MALVGTMLLVAASAKLRKRHEATIKIKQHYGVWMMRLEFALEDLNEAMELYYMEQNLISLNEEVYKTKLLDYVHQSILLYINEKQVELLSADLQIDKNRVDLMWTISEVPNHIATLNISVKTCAELPKHSTTLQFFHQQTMHRNVLNAANNFEMKLVL